MPRARIKCFIITVGIVSALGIILAYNKARCHTPQCLLSYQDGANGRYTTTPDRRQTKTLLTIEERGSKIARNIVLCF